MGESKEFFVHESSYVDEGVQIGRGTKIWHFCHVQSGAIIGERCSLGQNVNVAKGVHIGDGVRIQNNVSVYEGVELEDDVFCGPSCVFTNVVLPRAAFPAGGKYAKTLIRHGASLGANSTVVCGHTVGQCAMVGAGSVVASDVKDYALVVGCPAKQVGWVCACGAKLGADLECKACGRAYRETKGGLVEKTK